MRYRKSLICLTSSLVYLRSPPFRILPQSFKVNMVVQNYHVPALTLSFDMPKY